MLKLPVYLDNNATTPLDDRVLEAMMPYLTGKTGNASSTQHCYGWIAEQAVDTARMEVADLLNCDPRELIFTSGATEAVNLAIKGVYDAYSRKGKHIITSSAEHQSVLETCRFLEFKGAEVTYLPACSDGRIDPKAVAQAVRADTILIALMYANNETGVIHPVNEIAEIARNTNTIFFSDATQAVGKENIDVKGQGIHLMALSAHKLYGPKGVGALYMSRRHPRVNLNAQIHGGGQERRLRPGTLNVPGIVGLGKACSICKDSMSEEKRRLSGLRDKLEQSLTEAGLASVNGSTVHRLPHVSNLSFKNLNAQSLMVALGGDMAVSSGSACTWGSGQPSHVLKSMGLSDEAANSALRFSLGRFTTQEEINYTINQLMGYLSGISNG